MGVGRNLKASYICSYDTWLTWRLLIIQRHGQIIPWQHMSNMDVIFKRYGFKTFVFHITKDPLYFSSREQSLSFLAATKQLNEWYFLSVCPSVCLSVCLSHLFDYVSLIVSSWNFQELLPMTEVMSMQKFKVRGQRSRSQRSTPNLAISGL